MNRSALAFSFLAGALSGISASAQFETDYQPLRCEGPIPKDFITGAMEQFQMEQEELEAQKSGKANKKEKRFLLSGSYAMSRLLTSGKVLFGDPLTVYCDKVMGEVLKANPDVKHKVRIYVVKSSEVNAFATDQGIIFVTVGLLAKLDSEAQLAFILAHELVHHLKKHSIDIYFEKQEMARGRGQYRQYSVEDRIMQGSIYNKEKEKEADLSGYGYFSKTPYIKLAAFQVMDVLEYSHTPFADSVFDVSFFESGGLRFPDLYQLDTVQPVVGDAEDEGETHPSITARREYLEDEIGEGNLEGEQFIVSEEEFLRAREMARLELSRLYLLEQDYGRAIYNCYLLLQQHPNNKYLKVTLAKGLTGLSTYATDNDERDVLTVTYRVEGEMQRLYFLLNTLTEKGIAVTALVYDYDLFQQYPDDPEVGRLLDNSIRTLAENYETLGDFVSELPEDFKAIIDSIKPPEEKGKVKKTENPYEVGKVAVKSALTRSERKAIEEKFLKYALVQLLGDEDFRDRFSAEREEIEQAEKDEDLKESNYTLYAKRHAEEIKKERMIYKKGYRLGIDKLIIVDPGYVQLDYRRRNPFHIERSVKGEATLQEALTTCAELLHINYALLDPGALKPSETDRFNDLGALNEWFSEQLSFDEKAVTGTNEGQLGGITRSYGTSSALWLTVVKYQQVTVGARVGSIFPSVFPGFIPVGFYSMFVPRPVIVTIGILYDLNTGEETATFYRVQRHHGNPAALKSSLCDILWQINATR